MATPHFFDFMEQSGITSSKLLSYETLNISHLQELPGIPNGLVIELLLYKDRNSFCSFKTLQAWIRDIYGKRWPTTEAPSPTAIAKSIERLKAKLTKLRKQHNSIEKQERISSFLQEEYSLPRLGIHNGKLHQFSPTKKVEPKNVDLTQKMYSITRNANKRIKRRDAIIEKQKQTIMMYESKLKRTESQLSKLRKKLNAVNHRATYWKEKVGDIKDKNSTCKKELHQEIKLLKEKALSVDIEMDELKELLTSEIKTFEGGKYTDDIRACIYELLSLNVGVRNVASIIQCVLTNLAHKPVGRLPSYGLTCQMLIESLTVAQAQLGEELAGSSGCNTLQTDGTTKFNDHYSTYDVRTSDKNTYTLGLRHVFSSSANDTLVTFKEILEDLDSVQYALGKDAVSAKIITKIKNTMSDRHAAEKLFNELLHDYRAEILPTVTESWDQMTESEKEQLLRMNNFFCGLHFLIALAESAEETLKLWESQSGKEISGSSGTQRLIRTSCKAFHHRGSEQCGCSAAFRMYLRKQEIYKVPLADFVGNRFNIIFYDAAGVYYLHQHMIKYIQNVHGRHANRLLQSVATDLNEPMYISGCRALGLIDKIVTGPLWRKSVESSVSILEMSNVYSEMKIKFEEWSTDSYSLIEGIAHLRSDMVIHNDEVFQALILSNDAMDIMTQEILQLIFKSFTITTQRMLFDHLPGGQYDSSTEVDPQEVASVPTSNISPERDFAALDRLMREKPNACLVALESMILYAYNRTSSWLEQKTIEQKQKLLQAARTMVPTVRAKFKMRRDELEARRIVALAKKQADIQKQHLKLVHEKESLTKEIEKVGLWTTKSDIETGVRVMLKKTAKIKSLKLQLKFREKVLCQIDSSNKSLFKFSCHKQQYSVEKLKENLLLLLSAHAEEKDNLEDVMLHPESLVGQRIKHQFEVDGELVWYNGKVMDLDLDTKIFSVAYDDDDCVYNFALLEDIANGDLIIDDDNHL